MDNLAHGLVGAALGEAGLKEKTGLGMATLILAANLPDVDVLGLFFNENLAWRRGWTHGPVAMLILPPLLVAAMVAFDRWQTKRGKRPPARLPLHIGWLFALAYIGWFTHPLLDFFNTYGIRLLMPFSDRWFYGDTLFIIDPWLWSALAIGVWLSRQRRKKDASGPRMPAQASIALVATYAAVMGGTSVAAERIATEAVEARGLGPVRTAVSSPAPVDPFRRDIVVATADSYVFGELRWTPAPVLTLSDQIVPTNLDDPAIAAARREKHMADFLYWSRLPFATIERHTDETVVRITDARYSSGATAGRFGEVVKLPPDQPGGAGNRP